MHGQLISIQLSDNKNWTISKSSFETANVNNVWWKQINKNSI